MFQPKRYWRNWRNPHIRSGRQTNFEPHFWAKNVPWSVATLCRAGTTTPACPEMSQSHPNHNCRLSPCQKKGEGNLANTHKLEELSAPISQLVGLQRAPKPPTFQPLEDRSKAPFLESEASVRWNGGYLRVKDGGDGRVLPNLLGHPFVWRRHEVCWNFSCNDVACKCRYLFRKWNRQGRPQNPAWRCLVHEPGGFSKMPLLQSNRPVTCVSTCANTIETCSWHIFGRQKTHDKHRSIWTRPHGNSPWSIEIMILHDTSAKFYS